KSKRSFVTATLMGTLSLLCVCVAPFFGPSFISPTTLWAGDEENLSTILWMIRIPRVLLAFFAGAGLASGGLAFQALFRNPLATPYTLGVSSGAALGVALYYQVGRFSFLSLWGGALLFALVGA